MDGWLDGQMDRRTNLNSNSLRVGALKSIEYYINVWIGQKSPSNWFNRENIGFVLSLEDLTIFVCNLVVAGSIPCKVKFLCYH